MIYLVAVLDFVIEAMADAVFGIDPAGNITLTNSSAAALSGFSADELQGKPIAQLLVDDDDGLRTVVRKRIAGGDILRREASWIVTKSGAKVPVAVTGSPVLDAGGQLRGIVLVARDMREMRRLLAEKEAEIARRQVAEDELRAAKASIESQLEEARTQLMLAERRATLGTLAGGVGHELRNIAQIQIAATDELASAMAAGDDLHAILSELIGDFERVGEHIAAHGQRLMQLARPGPDHVAPLDLKGVIRDVAAMLRLAGKLRNVGMDLVLGDAPLTVTVNRTRIEQILVNLIINAVDAIAPDSGQVTVEVKPHDDAARVSVEVRDTGHGIAPAELDKIFLAFYTTKGERGTGLGLPVVREIVHSYGGTLTVTSEPGCGATFRFDLPR